MLSKLNYLFFILCNMFVGCLAGWLFIFATPSCAILLLTTYTISLFLFDERFKC